MGIMAGPDLMAFLSVSRGNPRGLLHATRRFGRHVYDLVTRRRGLQLVNGTALVGRLLRSALDLGVDVRVASPVTELLRDDDGRVTGVVADHSGRPAADHRDPRRRARGGRLPAGRRPPPGAVPAHPDRHRALVAGPDDRGWRGHDAGRVGRAAGCAPTWPPPPRGARSRWCPTAPACPSWRARRVPAHHGPREARQHRRALDGQAVRQRGRRLPRLRHGDDRRGARGRAGAVVADRRLPVRAPLPAGHGQAAARCRCCPTCAAAT